MGISPSPDFLQHLAKSRLRKMAAETYLEETGNTELNAHWIAEFFHDCGVQDAYPRQDLIVFAEMVQKELAKKDERAAKKRIFYYI